jgi:hypothetical protein
MRKGEFSIFEQAKDQDFLIEGNRGHLRVELVSGHQNGAQLKSPQQNCDGDHRDIAVNK